MPLLNTADKIYVGGNAAAKVYLGSNLVWEPAGGVEYGPPQSIYPVSVSPTPVSESLDYALGSRISILTDGRVTHIRYYRHADQLTSRVVKLWDDIGTQLFSGTTSGEVAGWNTHPVDPPLLVTVGDAIRVTMDYYGTTDGSYPITENLTIPADTADLDWLSGCFSTTPGAFPAQLPTTFNYHYFVDIVYEPEEGGVTAGDFIAPDFRAKENTGYVSNQTSIAVNKPAGTAENDILLASVFRGRATASFGTITPPSGFTLIGTTDVGSGGFYGQFKTYWKRAGASEPSSYTWDHAGVTTNDQAYIAAYSGCPISGDPIDHFSQVGQNSGATLTAPGVTTSQSNDKLVWLGHNWDATGALNPPGGMTERYDHLTYSADQTIVGTGATGTRVQTQASSNPAAAFLIALKGHSVNAVYDSLLTSYTPGTDRNDFTGEVGVRLGIGASPITVSWIGARRHHVGQTGTHTVKLYEWFGATVERTAVIDYTGIAVGDWAWTAITPITLTAGGYYALLMETFAGDGQIWCNPGPASYTGMANVYDSYWYGGLQTGLANSAFIGLDLGW